MSQQPGDQFGNYRLVSPIGSGGFATVWLGEHTTMGRSAAIKILSMQLPTPEEHTKFLNEARFLASLDHPNIVRVLDCDVQNDIPFLILDYAPNGTLRKCHPKSSWLAPDMIVTYVKQIAAGLQYAHDRRLIHRDIKPDNMLLGRNNEVLISDFGVAQAMRSVSYLKTQNITGTPSYMAPEQIDGKATLASDQYSLGVMVYEWLSGSLPFTGDVVTIRTQQGSKPPQLMNIAPALEQVVLQALSEDLNIRFRNVQEFSDALEQVVNNVSNPLLFNNLPIQNNPWGIAPTVFSNNSSIHNTPLGTPSPIPQNNSPIHNTPLGTTSPFFPNNPLDTNSPSGSSIPFPHITPLTPGSAVDTNRLILPDPAGGNSTPHNPLAANIPSGRRDSNASTVAAQPGSPILGSSQSGSMSGQRKRTMWFNRSFLKDRKNRRFVYGGGTIDFILAVALGIWLNVGAGGAGDLSWDLWLGSMLIAWSVRALCAGLTQKQICMTLALALTFYWFVGSWALGTIATLQVHIIPSHIIAILAFLAGLFVHFRYVLNTKK